MWLRSPTVRSSIPTPGHCGRLYACFDNEDYATRVKAFLAPSVVWHVAGNNPLSGDFRGPDAVADQMLRYERHSRGTLRLDTSIMASDSHAVAIR